jgi:hypothetical protein
MRLSWRRKSISLWFIAIFISGVSMARAEEPVSKFIRRTDEANIVIVFVHGILGDGRTTWTGANGKYWPDMIANDPAFKDADIFVFSYSTGLLATMSIDELAENMRLVLGANGVTRYQKIAFLSHSMGGLVTRAFLLKNRNVANKTMLAYFYSTPTTGSQVASVVNAFFGNPQSSKMTVMKSGDYLGDLFRNWLNAGFSFPSYCAYEKRPTNGVSLVVEMSSAGALCTKPLDPIDADHSSIVKPESETASSYLAFKTAYEETKESKTDDQTQTSKIASEIAEVIRFPNAADANNPPTTLEGLLNDKKPQLIFKVLERHNSQDIEAVPRTGKTLLQYKSDYYDFREHEKAREALGLARIGTMVRVQFRVGWSIYWQYFLLRQTGNSMEAIKGMGNFLNYEITWEDAERVFVALSNDPEFSKSNGSVVLLFKKVMEEAQNITTMNTAKQ